MTMPNYEQSRAELVERLRGIYRIPITDGLGAVGSGDEPDNPNEFVRSFETSPIMREAASAIEALEAENARLREDYEGQKEQVAIFATKLASAKATIKRMREALTPFAEASAGIDDSCHPDWEMWEHPAAMNVFVRDFRRARSALNPEREEK